MPPTLIGITLLVFTVTRFVPGGPMDKILQEAASGEKGGGGRAGAGGAGGMSEEQIEEMEEAYGVDQPVFKAYCQWLGVWPKESSVSKGEYGSASEKDSVGGAIDSNKTAVIVLKGDGREVHVHRENGVITSAVYAEGGKPVAEDGWAVRYETEQDRKDRNLRRNPKAPVNTLPAYHPRAVIFKKRFDGLLQGQLGRSTTYNDPVIELIADRIPIAVYFGLLSTIITTAVCLPLGILKALKHRTFIDSFSSVLIFLGYSIPGFAMGAVLLVYFGARWHWFPMFGMTSANFDQMAMWDQVKDVASHTVLPLLCYVVSSFAFQTMLMKNSLMDNLAADYVRTAVAKGVSFRAAVFKHAFRNSLIPLATSFGNLISILVTGSMLIEAVFDIQGFGLLQYQSVQGRDIPVIMGTLTIAAFLMLLGNLLSDVIVAMVDPRIKFD